MKVAVLGCGVMGSAFARQLSKKGDDLYLCDRSLEKGGALAKELGAQFSTDPREAVSFSEYVLLAIKPKDLDQIAEQLKGLNGGVLLSILAGTSVSELKGFFPTCQIIRAMPNLALIHGESVIALVDEHGDLDEGAKQATAELLKGMGMVFWTGEEQIEPITALAGSGPAFIIAIIEALVDGGIMMGLKADRAKELALQMIKGAVALVEHHQGHPGGVRWEISAPKGTTIAGIHAFEEAGIRKGIMNTLLATYNKAKDMR